MNKTIYYLFTFFLLLNSINAQWVKTSPDTLGSLQTMINYNNSIILGTSTKGVFISNDQGNTWNEKNTGLPSTNINKIITDQTKIYLTISYYGLYRSIDGGNSWELVSNEQQSIAKIKSMAISGNNLFAATELGVIKSANAGASWDSVNTGLPSRDVRSVFIIGQNIFASIYNKGIYRSTIDNINWIDVSSGLSQYSMLVRYMVNDPADTNKIFIGTDDGVFYSNDGGTSWTSVSSNIGSNVVSYLLFVGNDLFAAMGSGNGGIYVSSNYGTSWNTINDGLPQYSYSNGLIINSSKLFIANNADNSVWSRPLSQITNVETDKKIKTLNNYHLKQNYPNPFNPTTTIKYSIPFDVKTQNTLSTGRQVASQLVQLKVYNILGKEIAILVKQKQNSGTYEVNFDASNLTSGIYYYTLKVGNFSETKKMVLLR